MYPQETVAKKYDSHCRVKPEQQLENRAALLRDEVFGVIPGTVNTQCGAASKIEEQEIAVIIVKMRCFNYLGCQICPLQAVAMGRK